MAADTPQHRYDAKFANTIEPLWQARWEDANAYRTPNPGEPGFDGSRPKFYCLDMFPYPSGAGLHVGHPEGYTATDIICRYKRAKGFNVLHPMGYDAFGLPAEQYAIQTGVHPALTTKKSIENFRRQLKRFGFSYDWSREFATIDPEYYKWTQWVFLRLFNAWVDPRTGRARHIDELARELDEGRGPAGAPDAAAWRGMEEAARRAVIDGYRLVYRAEATVNWCPKLGTVLANDEVIDGRSERGGHPVVRKPLKQWMFRITAMAERLLNDLNLVEWPASTKTMQQEWIGRSEGAEVEFGLVARLSEPSPECAETVHPGVHFDDEPSRALRPKGFRGFDPYPHGEKSPSNASFSVRDLPHIEIPGATYFVTWRAVKGVVLSERDRSVVLDALVHWDGRRCRVYAACVMPDHVHWIVRPDAGESVRELAASVKRFSATHINQGNASAGSVWQPECFDHIIRDEAWLGEAVAYTLLNPVRDGLCSRVKEYPWVRVHESLVRSRTRDECAEERGSESRATTDVLRVFTTRPDTIFGATYMVVAPEHPLVAAALARPSPRTDAAKLRAYAEAARNRSDIDRQADSKVKTGVDTGLDAINPATGKAIPVWTADYVLMGYGTGAIMAVPAQDERDWAFAEAFGLAVARTVQPPEGFEGGAFTGDGPAINSEFLNGLGVAEAKAKAIEWVESKGIGRRRVNYKLRDWAFSRQRYWGEPFPIVYDEQGNAHAVGEKSLPVVLPELADYSPAESDEPQPLLAKAASWVNTTAGAAGVEGLPANTPVRRETNTMPGSAGSSWYYLRYCDAKNGQRFVSREAEGYWMVSKKASGGTHAGGVDLYVGGSEHAVGHLLYSRFWHKVLFDLGEVSTPEPFGRLFHQGLITSFAFQRPDKTLCPNDQVTEQTEGVYVETSTGARLTPVVAKMSKSLKNVVNPDDVIAEYGADTFRLYEMYMGPLEASKPWNPRDIVGMYRFLQKLWRVVIDEDTGAARLAPSPDGGNEKRLHRLIAKAGADVETLSFNTAIAAMIQFVNDASPGSLTKDQAGRLAVVVGVFAPHIAEEVWHRTGHEGLCCVQAWPVVDPTMLTDSEVEMPVQVNGKLKGRVMVPANADAKAIEAIAAKDEKVAQAIEGKPIKKVIVVPGKMVNFIV